MALLCARNILSSGFLILSFKDDDFTIWQSYTDSKESGMFYRDVGLMRATR